MRVAIVAVLFFVIGSASAGVLERPADHKELKKLLRTKNNVLLAFVPSESNTKWRKWQPILSTVSDEIFGKGTIGVVDCGSDEGKKTCKKLKLSPVDLELKHYSNGEFHKDYDRQQTVDSLRRFMLDPTGDAPWEEDPSSAAVRHLNDPQAFKKLLKTEKLPILLMFYAPWCGHCKRLKPEYGQAAAELKGTAVLGAMDVDRPENAPVRTALNITGYPTLLYFEQGALRFQYGGENNKEGILKWIRDPQPPKAPEPEKEWADEASDVSHLTDDNFDAHVAAHPSVLVMFYAPWCGHCKAMKPDYVAAAAQLAADGKQGHLAALDATKHRKMAEKYGVKGFPSLKYFKDGEYAWDFQERSKDKILSFLANPAEPPPPPEPEKPWPEEDSHVVHLSSEDFVRELKKRKHALVMFYAPWCGHCKRAKPHFVKAADTFKDDPKVMFGAVDCTQHKSICEENHISGYPTLWYFSYHKQRIAYEGAKTEADFVKYISAAIDPSPPAAQPKKEQAQQKEEPSFDPSVLVVNHENFESMSEAPVALVMYFAPWCGHCQRAKPEFGAAAKLLSPPEDTGMLFAAVDCTQYEDLCKDVDGYPTFKLYKMGEFVKEYSGGRTKADFVKALKDLKNAKSASTPSPSASTEDYWDPAVLLLNHQNYESIDGAPKAIVMHFAPWCGHCKKAKVDFGAAAKELSPTEDTGVLFAAVDCTEYKDLCKDVRGYPTFKMYMNGAFVKEHSGARSKDGFVAAVKELKQTATTSDEPPPDWDPSVVHLNHENYNSVSEAPVALVMHYAPWCGHCKSAKPAFGQAAKALAPVEDTGVLVAAVDCTEYKDLCKEVSGYPTFKLYRKGEFVKKHAGGRAKEDFVAAVNEVKSGTKTEL